MTKETERRYGDSILHVAMRENIHVFDRMKEREDGIMCQALREFFADELNEAVKTATKKATEQNKKDMIFHALKGGSSAMEIARVLRIPLETVEAVEKDMLEAV